MSMPNPIPENVRGILYTLSISLGILSVVVGPLMVALAVKDVWAAVVLSLMGAITTLTSTLARANLRVNDEDDDEDRYAHDPAVVEEDNILG